MLDQITDAIPHCLVTYKNCRTKDTSLVRVGTGINNTAPRCHTAGLRLIIKI